MRRATERRMNWLWSLVISVLESMTVICTGRTENKLDLLSTEKNDFAFCDCSAVIHKIRFYLNALANEVIFVLLYCTLVYP